MSPLATRPPYHASASERIAATEARLGRKVWAARELPDDLARALYWKRRRWYFAAAMADAGDNDNRFNAAFDEHAEAESAHELLIREMWLRRTLALEGKAWAALARVGTALVADDCVAMTARATEAALDEVMG